MRNFPIPTKENAIEVFRRSCDCMETQSEAAHTAISIHPEILSVRHVKLCPDKIILFTGNSMQENAPGIRAVATYAVEYDITFGEYQELKLYYFRDRD